MAFTFNADEVFEIAEQIERNGGRFYRKAAELVDDDDSKQLMLRLAKMEDEHENFFADLRIQLKPNEKEETVYDPDGEAARYLQAFADGHVFDINVNPEDRFKPGDTFADIIRTAIGFEKDAIVFFLGIKGLVPESLGKDKIEELIQEEQRHIVILTKHLRVWKEQQGRS